MEKPENPPAFPYQHTPAHGGMSLRDWFAGMVAAGFSERYSGRAVDPEGAARAAYEIADALIAERAKRA